ncbi:MAG: hypothetical protein NZ562_02705, partial [Thermomicrobium sp.]|nr:hypothetical protein [Thermomicrobium sp.]
AWTVADPQLRCTARGRSRAATRIAADPILATLPRGVGLQPGPVRLDVLDPLANRWDVVARALKASFTWALNEVGEFSCTLPATVPPLVGRQVRLVREGEGELFRGIVTTSRLLAEPDGAVCEIQGYSTARELVWYTTRFSWIVDQQTLSAALQRLVQEDNLPWTVSVDPEVASQRVSAIFEGATRFEAIAKLATLVQRNVRVFPIERRVEVTRGMRRAPVRLHLYPAPPSEAREEIVLPITRLRILRRDEDVVTRVIPVGAGEGVNTLTLRWSDRTSPYPIQSATYLGTTVYYIEDVQARQLYGHREKVVAFKNVAPIANSPAALRQAANALYDLAVTYLQAHKEPTQEWEVEVAGPFRQWDRLNSQWLLMPGDVVRVTARGVVEDVDGREVVVDLDEEAYVRSIERSFDEERETVKLHLTDTDKLVSDEDILAEVVDRLWALAVAQKTVPVREIHGPIRQSVQGNLPFRFVVDWDANVRFLHKAVLVVVCRPMRGNLTVVQAASSTVVTSSSQTQTLSTSTSGGAGNITVTESESAHIHDLASTEQFSAWSDPSHRELLKFPNASDGQEYG